jgi:hypothetical protein
MKCSQRDFGFDFLSIVSMYPISRLIPITVAYAALVCAGSACAQAIPDSNYKIGRLHDAYGVRLGVVVNEFGNKVPPIPNQFDAPPLMTGARPSLDPYYEAPLTRGLTASFDLMLVYRSFAVFGLSDFRFQSYGFNCELRWEPSVSEGDATASRRAHTYVAGGLGFDTFTDRVSVSLPLSVGALFPLSNTSEFELAGRITPQLFLGLGPGMYFGITAGIRFLNPL